MTERVVRTIKFRKVFVVLLASGIAFLVAAVIEDRSNVLSSEKLLLAEKAYADAPPDPPPPDGGDSDGC